jgi:hypothetical protein
VCFFFAARLRYSPNVRFRTERDASILIALVSVNLASAELNSRTRDWCLGVHVLLPALWRRAVNSPNGTRNRLLALMSPADRARLAPSIEETELDARQILEVPGEVISHVYFVESGLVSIVGTAPQGHRIEIGMVGFERDRHRLGRRPFT